MVGSTCGPWPEADPIGSLPSSRSHRLAGQSRRPTPSPHRRGNSTPHRPRQLYVRDLSQLAIRMLPHVGAPLLNKHTARPARAAPLPGWQHLGAEWHSAGAAQCLQVSALSSAGSESACAATYFGYGHSASGQTIHSGQKMWPRWHGVGLGLGRVDSVECGGPTVRAGGGW